MPTDAQTLLSESACTLCTIPFGMLPYVTLVILDHIRNGEPVSTDPQTLMSEAACLQCVIPPGMVPSATVAASIAIANSGSGGVTYGTVNPTTAPLGNSGIYYNTTTAEVWVWNAATSVWDSIIS